jgi:hypothetical protein
MEAKYWTFSDFVCQNDLWLLLVALLLLVVVMIILNLIIIVAFTVSFPLGLVVVVMDVVVAIVAVMAVAGAPATEAALAPAVGVIWWSALVAEEPEGVEEVMDSLAASGHSLPGDCFYSRLASCCSLLSCSSLHFMPG